MQLAEALEIVVGRTRHERYRDLCDPSHPQHETMAARVIAEAQGPWPPPKVAAPVVRPLATLPRDQKPRGSLADAVKRAQDCVPCREAKSFPPSRSLALRSYGDSWMGYGQIAGWLGRGLGAAGLDVAFVDVRTDMRYFGADPWLHQRKGRDKGGWLLNLDIPFAELPPDRPTVAMSMWETSRIRARSVECLNRAVAVVAPCRWNAEGFRASGVTRPIFIVPLGVSASEGYEPKPYAEGKPYTFGMAGRMAHGGSRKGLNEGMAAFVKAFDSGQDVRLKVKVFQDCLPRLRVPPDPRIVVITTPMRPHQMAEWYGGIDCLLVPSKGEGFGLHSLQAMACGRPLIAANYGGTAEFWDSRFGWELPFEEREATEDHYKNEGMWAVPTEEGMVAALRGAYADPGECRRRGDLAAERAKEFTWERSTAELVKVLRGVGAIL